MNSYLFTSESVTEGHPDKLCDLISDAVLDAYLAKDPMARVACETFAYYDGIHIAGEITSAAEVDIEKVARDVIANVGYTENECGFDSETCAIRISVCEQSPDIAMGVNSSDDTSATGAGDQGMMFGYACDETPELMPMPIALAHRLAKQLTAVRKNGILPYLLPDGKTQVTIRYENDIPVEVETVVVSSQHTDEVETEILRKGIYNEVILPVIGKWITDETRVLINPTGRFVIGGPKGDVGLTGRKIIVDTYGGSAAHGGGAFSGKDPTKVDRTAAYMARCAAKNVVAAGMAKKCQIQLAYAIGVSKPVSVRVDTFGTGIISEEEILRAVVDTFDFTPDGMIEFLGMRNPIFTQTAAYGHFGREDESLPWEKTEQAEILKKRIK